jgi:hypothetical protein
VTKSNSPADPPSIIGRQTAFASDIELVVRKDRVGSPRNEIVAVNSNRETIRRRLAHHVEEDGNLIGAIRVFPRGFLPDVLNGRRHPLKNVVVPGLPLGDDAAIVVNIAIVLEVLLLSSAIETSQPVQFSTIAMMAVAALVT